MTTSELISDCEDQLQEKEYEIEVYELHAATYRIKAKSYGEAVEGVLSECNGELIHSEYIEIAENYGMINDDIPGDDGDTEYFIDNGLAHEDGFVTSIRSIKEIK